MSEWERFDDIVKIGDYLFKRDCSIYGCYRNGVEILAKDMSEEELNRAHALARTRTFDIVGEENKGG